LSFEPVDIQAESFLQGQHLLQSFFFFLPVSNKTIATFIPLQVITILFFPAGNNVQASQRETNLGGIGMSSSQPTYGSFIRALSTARISVNNQNFKTGFSQKKGGWGANATSANDYNFITIRAIHCSDFLSCLDLLLSDQPVNS